MLINFMFTAISSGWTIFKAGESACLSFGVKGSPSGKYSTRGERSPVHVIPTVFQSLWGMAFTPGVICKDGNGFK